MSEMPPQSTERFPQYKDKIEEIRSTYLALIDKAFESLEPVNPAMGFKRLLEERFNSLEIKDPIESFAAYHYAVGSSPNENQKEFDTEDELILKTYREFAR